MIHLVDLRSKINRLNQSKYLLPKRAAWNVFVPGFHAWKLFYGDLKLRPLLCCCICISTTFLLVKHPLFICLFSWPILRNIRLAKWMILGISSSWKWYLFLGDDSCNFTNSFWTEEGRDEEWTIILVLWTKEYFISSFKISVQICNFSDVLLLFKVRLVQN